MEDRFTDVSFKHYAIDEGEQERLIEIWKHFFPNDNPEPKGGGIFISKKYGVVDPVSMMLNLAFPVLITIAWVSRFYTVCMICRTQKPVAFLYKKFLEKHKGEPEEKNPNDYDVTLPKQRPRKKKENKETKNEEE